jgi:hypothetical protein
MPGSKFLFDTLDKIIVHQDKTFLATFANDSQRPIFQVGSTDITVAQFR